MALGFTPRFPQAFNTTCLFKNLLSTLLKWDIHCSSALGLYDPASATTPNVIPVLPYPPLLARGKAQLRWKFMATPMEGIEVINNK